MSWWPPVTLILMLICAIVFGFEFATGALDKIERLTEMGAISAPHVEKGEFWRLLSAPFLHASADHIVGNLLMLFVLGLACEHAFGSSQFVFLFVAAALGGSFASLLNDKISVGASGAIFGLAGAIIAMFRRHQSKLHLRDRRIGLVIGIWAVYQIVIGFLSPQIDNLCHIGGFTAGMVFGTVIPPAVLHDRVEFGQRLSTIVMLALGCTALAATSVWFVPRLAG